MDHVDDDSDVHHYLRDLKNVFLMKGNLRLFVEVIHSSDKIKGIVVRKLLR